MLESKKILFFLSGSIACYKACQVISQLIQTGHKVQVVTTDAALEFVGRATLEGLTGNPVKTDLFESDTAMDHILLTKWADLAILCPASANTINHLSLGLAKNLVGNLYLAWDRTKPFLIAPAMNTFMFQHPSTQESLNRLKKWGATILPVDSGQLACGDEGPGRLIDPDEIISQILNEFMEKPSQNSSPRKVLITAGATTEPIDGVRYLSNVSSGKTGAIIADKLHEQGHEVFLLRGQNAQFPEKLPPQNISTFRSYDSLKRLLKRKLKLDWDSVIQCAAVSDYSINQVIVNNNLIKDSEDLKISSNSSLKLSFKKNDKLINKIKSWSTNKNISLFGFKLTKTEIQEAQEKAIKSVFSNSQCDFLIHNDLIEISNSKVHPFNVFDTPDGKAYHIYGAQELALWIHQKLIQKLCVLRPIEKPTKENQFDDTLS